MPSIGQKIIKKGAAPPPPTRTSTPRPAIPPTPDGWTVRDIHVVMEDDKKMKVSALVRGAIAVHVTVDDEKSWTISSVTTGRGILASPTREDALRMGAWIWENCRPAFSQSDPKRVIASLPLWARQWIATAWKKKECLDPAPFRAKYGGKKP